MAELLTVDEVAHALAGLTDWSGDTSAISRTVEAPSFPAAIRLVVEVAKVAEDVDHHPDIDIRWRRVTFTLSTHSAGGVTSKDARLAGQIDELALTTPPLRDPRPLRGYLASTVSTRIWSWP